MSSTNKTRLGLNKWVGTDIPAMADFNMDNQIIDTIIKNHIDDYGLHCSSKKQQEWNNPYGFYSYLGDGENEAEYDVKAGIGFEPSVCIVFAMDMPVGKYNYDYGVHYNYFGIATIDGGCFGLSLEDGILTVNSNASLNNEVASYNDSGKAYMVIGLR